MKLLKCLFDTIFEEDEAPNEQVEGKVYSMKLLLEAHEEEVQRIRYFWWEESSRNLCSNGRVVNIEQHLLRQVQIASSSHITSLPVKSQKTKIKKGKKKKGKSSNDLSRIKKIVFVRGTGFMTIYKCINLGIGWASSGVEYAQIRAKLLRSVG